MPCRNGSISSSVPWSLRRIKTARYRQRVSERTRPHLLIRRCAAANQRLKLRSGDRPKGSGVVCAWRGTDLVRRPCADERVARSFSAIRWAAARRGANLYLLRTLLPGTSRGPMAFTFELAHLLDYTEWERAQWHAWFHEQGPAALAVDLGPNSDGRVNTIGELVRHIFSAEQRYVARIQGAPLTAFPPERWVVPQQIQIGKHSRAVTPRKLIVQAVTHEIRHWAQVATFLRMSGRKPGPRDFLVSPVLEP